MASAQQGRDSRSGTVRWTVLSSLQFSGASGLLFSGAYGLQFSGASGLLFSGASGLVWPPVWTACRRWFAVVSVAAPRRTSLKAAVSCCLSGAEPFREARTFPTPW